MKTFINLDKDKNEYSIESLSTLAKEISNKLKSLPSDTLVTFVPSWLLTQKKNFNKEDSIHELHVFSNIIKDIVDDLKVNNEVTESVYNQIIEITDNANKLLRDENITFVQLTKIIDWVIINIFSIDDLTTIGRSKFSEKLNQIIAKKSLEKLELNFTQGTFETQPINISYVTNIENLKTREKELRNLKQQIKSEIRSLVSQRRVEEHSSASIMAKYNDYLVDSDVEEYENNRSIEEIKDNDNKISVPASLEQLDVEELVEIMERRNVNQETYSRAKIQLLRIYREYINILISDVLISKAVVEDQENYEFNKPDRRMGIEESHEVTRERNNIARRVALFQSAHLGFSKSHEVSFNLDNSNYLPINSQIIQFWAENGINKNLGKSVELNGEVLNMFTKLFNVMDIRLTQLDERKLPEKIITNILDKIGILSNETDRQVQLNDFYSKKGYTDVKTFTTKDATGSVFSIQTNYRTFNIPKNLDRTLGNLMPVLAHEVVHILQQISRDNTPLPGITENTFGRSSILAESGARKVESILYKMIKGEDKETKTIHFDIVRMITEGKTYAEIFKYVFEITRKTDLKEGKTISDSINSTKTMVDRGYGNGGAMGAEESRGRYPTNAGFLSYTYQGMAEYSNLPFYTSGVPSHRKDLLNIFKPPQVNGQEITETLVIEAVISSCYEVLLDTGIITP